MNKQVFKIDNKEIKASKIADKLAIELFSNGDVGVMQANSVYLDIKKILYHYLK
tara:strand:+ start:400 stop:561 length:162 start_codon:yes stop_codon:yes gene_type:complete